MYVIFYKNLTAPLLIIAKKFLLFIDFEYKLGIILKVPQKDFKFFKFEIILKIYLVQVI